MKIEIERNSVGLYSIKAGNKLVHYKKSWQFVKGWLANMLNKEVTKITFEVK